MLLVYLRPGKPKHARNSVAIVFFFSMMVSLFVLFGFYDLSTVFQSYHDGVGMWQGAKCSLLEYCLSEISCPKHMT